MPQMATLNWTILFIFSTLIFMMTNSMNYHSFKQMPKSNKMKIIMKLNWKW